MTKRTDTDPQPRSSPLTPHCHHSRQQVIHLRWRNGWRKSPSQRHSCRPLLVGNGVQGGVCLLARRSSFGGRWRARCQV